MGDSVSEGGVEMMCWSKVSMRVRGMMLGVRRSVGDRVDRGRRGRRRRVEDDRRRGGEEERGPLATPSSGVDIFLLLQGKQ